ncbi:hypothetical protein PMIN04_011189 [Paraphaeosphaeria minitans]|uniref:Uncharacterized protein n=1 Tax=Paraphaeosphaeria minitans TaxID=565426 RepID=A0A9P6GC00_9PLEO|nr:hypothetical protein PMIN01_10169 [Paraphaeosphaeria minitans]
MIPDAQLLTGPTTLATCNPDLSFTAKSLISSSFIFFQVSPDTKQDDRMAAPRNLPCSVTSDDRLELWLAMPPPIPSIKTTAQFDKPLPPSPGSHKIHKPGLLNLIKKKPYGHSDASHLRPAPLNIHKRTSSNEKLSPGLPPHYHQSRSMPSSPLEYSPPHPSHVQRAHSAAAQYPDVPQYQAYTPRPQITEQQRAVSLGTPFEPIDPRPRRGSTFPESSTMSSPIARESVSDAPRPHTWVSPTETHAAFGDTTDFHLFAEATAGLPGGFDAFSPTETPRLQGSLFARGSQNDIIPLLARDIPAQSVRVPVPDYGWVPRQAPRDYSVSSSALPQVSSSALPRRDLYDMDGPPSPLRPNLNTINLELERLGLSDLERPPDDELPDYAQSQAEMAAQKRNEASARAQELESRWNLARGWRNW